MSPILPDADVAAQLPSPRSAGTSNSSSLVPTRRRERRNDFRAVFMAASPPAYARLAASCARPATGAGLAAGKCSHRPTRPQGAERHLAVRRTSPASPWPAQGVGIMERVDGAVFSCREAPGPAASTRRPGSSRCRHSWSRRSQVLPAPTTGGGPPGPDRSSPSCRKTGQPHPACEH